MFLKFSIRLSLKKMEMVMNPTEKKIEINDGRSIAMHQEKQIKRAIAVAVGIITTTTTKSTLSTSFL